MLIALRTLDLVLAAVALVVFLVAGWPVAGWALGATLWLLWRGIGAALDAQAAKDPANIHRFAVLQASSSLGRGWVLLVGLLAGGLLISREVGLAAAVLCAVLFTVYFSLRIALRPIVARTTSHTAS